MAAALPGFGCARDAGEIPPDEALSEFLAAIEASVHEPAQRKEAYEWLDKSSRTALAARAQRTTSLAGRRLQPWEMLVPGRLGFASLGLAKVRRQVTIEGNRATVAIPLEMRAPAEILLVREEGRWRVVLGL